MKLVRPVHPTKTTVSYPFQVIDIDKQTRKVSYWSFLNPKTLVLVKEIYLDPEIDYDIPF